MCSDGKVWRLPRVVGIVLVGNIVVFVDEVVDITVASVGVTMVVVTIRVKVGMLAALSVAATTLSEVVFTILI